MDSVIIARLQEFKEGLLEKQQRLHGEWKTLTRGKKTALEMAQESGHEEVVAQLQKPAAVIARQVRELS